MPDLLVASMAYSDMPRIAYSQTPETSVFEMLRLQNLKTLVTSVSCWIKTLPTIHSEQLCAYLHLHACKDKRM